jgi:asparagine synthase (glutamine-hydrolysing)
MCGLAGLWGPLPDKAAALDLSCRRLRHRGPDDQGYWEDRDAGLALAHVRLAVLDLSQAGHQPMVSACGTWVLVLNGEIYNHLALRARLEQARQAPAWRGHSDTETLLACFAAWGVQQSLQAATGMFALALWNRQHRRLTLARDRLGEKPLYYGYAGSDLAFASELKGVTAVPGGAGAIDRDAVALLLRHNYIPAPHTIYRNLRKLPPGSWVDFSAADVHGAHLPPPVAYWSACQAADASRASPLVFESPAAATDALEAVLSAAVDRQMLSDVPLGAFLSGGVDSSTVVALMQARGGPDVRTFSIGFAERQYDESAQAKAVAAHLGTRHTQLRVSARDALDVVPLLPDIYDEPYADASQIPTVLLARLARQHVTVALSGDGGDELFGGYARYARAQRWWQRRAGVPGVLRIPLAAAAAQAAQRLRGRPGWAHKSRRLQHWLEAAHPGEFYRDFVSYWQDAETVATGARGAAGAYAAAMDGAMPETMMKLDAVTYLPDDILVKIDRAAMACGLETRVPLIDHHVYEFAWRLPLHYKMRGSVNKWLLRQVLYRHVPAALVDRPKQGFGVPLGAWLRGPLREWAEPLLDESRLRGEGLLDAGPVLRKWREHLAGKRDWSSHLWSVLMLQAWLDRRGREGS